MQKYKFSTPAGAGTEHSIGIQPVNEVNEQDKKPPRSCKFCGYKHLFTKPSRCPAVGKLCLKCKQKGRFAQVCPANVKGGSQGDVVQNSQSSSQEVLTYFESIELGSVLNARKSRKSLLTIQIGGQAVEIKADTGAEATVIPYHLYEKITKEPLQQIQQPLKGWLATKPVHPRGCVRLATRYNNRQMDFLYLVVDGNFTPLLGCDACLDLEVLKFINLQLIDSPVPEQAAPKTQGAC